MSIAAQPVSQPASGAIFAEFSRIRPQDQAWIEKTITAEDIDAFAAVSGDTNPLHLDDEFAQRTTFQRRVAHGMLVASYLSTLIGTRLPGPGALWMQQSFRWLAPVFIGDVIKVCLTVTHVSQSTRVVSVAVGATNQAGRTVMEGEGKVMLLEERKSEETSAVAGRAVFVSGGSRGIGAAIARAFAAAGADVAVNFQHHKESAEELCRGLVMQPNGAGRIQAVAVQSDVADANAVAAAMDSASDAFGKPMDFLIHTAAPPAYGRPFLETSWDDVDRQLAVQLRGAFNCCQAVLPGMVQRNFGAIVHIGAAMTWGVPAPNWSAFLAAKAALKSLTKSLASEFGPRGIRVNMVSPGMTETDAIADIPERMRKVQAMQTPLRRLGRPEDIAQTALFLCSPAGAFITGTDVPVCGGSVM
jgi:3-oxoacyl-[acyl-carrier protein] reductase